MPNKPAPGPRQSPSAKGDPRVASGGRSRNPNSLANLRKWAKGQSGNPSGKSAALNTIMRQAREHAPECIERLLSIVRDPKAAHRDVIAACLAILDRGLGRPIVPIFRNTSTGLPDEMVFGGGAGDNEVTALIMAARAEGGDYRKALADELARLDREEREEKAARKDEIDEARAAQARGEPISPLMKMLISVQDETS